MLTSHHLKGFAGFLHNEPAEPKLFPNVPLICQVMDPCKAVLICRSEASLVDNIYLEKWLRHSAPGDCPKLLTWTY